MMAPHTSERGQRAYWFYGDLVIVHVSGEETDGRFSLTEWLQPPGEMTPVHVHRRADQTQYVLEGELTVHLEGRTIVAGPGECAHGPDGSATCRAGHLRRARQAGGGQRAGRVRTIRGRGGTTGARAGAPEPAAAASGLGGACRPGSRARHRDTRRRRHSALDQKPPSEPSVTLREEAFSAGDSFADTCSDVSSLLRMEGALK
jgi:Cupin domain